MEIFGKSDFSAKPPSFLLSRIERLTRQNLEQLQSEPLAAKRERIETEKNTRMRFVRRFPLIGRGCVLGDHLKTRERINRELDRCLNS